MFTSRDSSTLWKILCVERGWCFLWTIAVAVEWGWHHDASRSICRLASLRQAECLKLGRVRALSSMGQMPLNSGCLKAFYCRVGSERLPRSGKPRMTELIEASESQSCNAPCVVVFEGQEKPPALLGATQPYRRGHREFFLHVPSSTELQSWV